jgi:hypothetical protein
MKTAPIGLGAYFAYQVGIFGPQLFGAYAKPRIILWCLLYFSLCTFFLAGGKIRV